jgi:glycolate oxidase
MDQRLVDQFRRAIGAEAVLTEPVQLLTYECDALPHLRSLPDLVLLPQSAADVQAIV